MAILQELIETQRQAIAQEQLNNQQIGLIAGDAYARYFPGWEVTTPQYQVPQALTLANLGYRTNEVAYACIDLWMNTISEPNIKVYDRKTDEIIKEHDIEEFFREPTPGLTETDFWKASVMYLKIAGVLAWEKETKNNGGLKAIWPMMPQYCSYKRGEGALLRTIQYQPYTGLPAYNVPRENVLLFMYQDPQYFGLKPLSPTAVLADIIKVDNDMTKLVSNFLRNGAFVSGLLKTEQVINEQDAKFARERWQESHGGPNNAGQVAVMGKGLEFQSAGQSFREMVFPEVDARSETRICQGYGVKPILVSAKVGMDRSTFSNYEQAREAWYEENVFNEWAYLSQCITRDILPHFDKNPNHEVRFDIRNVMALEKRRNEREENIINKAKANLITRDEARVKLGDEKIDNVPVFVGLTTQQQLGETQDIFQPGGGDDKIDQGDETAYGRNEREKQEKLELQREQMQKEEKDFRSFAKRRLKEEKPNDLVEFEFKHVSENRRRQLLTEYGIPDPDAAMVLEGLKVILAEMKRPQDINIKAQFEKQDPPVINVEAPKVSVEAPQVTIENKIPEQKAIQPNVTVNVEPTPIQNNIEMEAPKVKRSFQKVKRDGGNNIEGTMTEYEYDD